jgi:hypothetical protein
MDFFITRFMAAPIVSVASMHILSALVFAATHFGR